MFDCVCEIPGLMIVTWAIARLSDCAVPTFISPSNALSKKKRRNTDRGRCGCITKFRCQPVAEGSIEFEMSPLKCTHGLEDLAFSTVAV
jgi:hypothetical protein